MKYPAISIIKNPSNSDNVLTLNESSLVALRKSSRKDCSIAISDACLESIGGKAGHCICLSSNYDWVLGYNEIGNLVVVPLKKKD